MKINDGKLTVLDSSPSSTYDSKHTEDECDCCLRKVGKNKLIVLDFLYMDKNDLVHKDFGNGYRNYSVCKKCFARGV